MQWGVTFPVAGIGVRLFGLTAWGGANSFSVGRLVQISRKMCHTLTNSTHSKAVQHKTVSWNEIKVCMLVSLHIVDNSQCLLTLSFQM